MVRGAVKKRETEIKQRANRVFYFHGYLGKFCTQGGIGTQMSFKTERDAG